MSRSRELPRTTVALVADYHHLGGFDEAVGRHPDLQTESLAGIPRDDGSQRLIANCDCYLCQQSLYLDAADRAEEFVAATDRIEWS